MIFLISGRSEEVGPLESELEVVVNQLMWVLGIELWTFRGAVHALNH